jgi:hypothetical protein
MNQYIIGGNNVVVTSNTTHNMDETMWVLLSNAIYSMLMKTDYLIKVQKDTDCYFEITL